MSSEPATPASAMAQRHGRMLARLAEMAFEQAEALHQRVLKAQTTEEADRMATAFHRVSRAVRLAISLEARLTQEAEVREQEAPSHLENHEIWAQNRIVRRKVDIRKALARSIRHECKGRKAEETTEKAELLLGEVALEPGFLDAPIPAQIAGIRRLLGLNTLELDIPGMGSASLNRASTPLLADTS